MMDKQNLVRFPGAEGRPENGRWKTPVRLRKLSASASRLFLSRRWTLLIAVVGFLLGRAVILDTLAPFAVAWFAVVWFLRRDAAPVAALALVAGAWLADAPVFWSTAAELAVFFLLARGLEAYERAEISYAPLLAFISALLVRLFGVVMEKALDGYELLMVAVEAGLAFVLTLVFIQAVPVLLLTRKPALLRNEEIVCLMILLASIMTGAAGWAVYDLEIPHVLSRYVLLLFALAGGALLGASVGVIAGLVLSLADFGDILQMSLLAFAGLLAGLLREGGKPAAAFGMLLGTAILSIYIGGAESALASTWESALAALLFLATPQSMLKTIARHVPGTAEHARSQHEYARRVRDVTARRVTQFSEIFRQLAESFAETADIEPFGRWQQDRVHLVNAAAEAVCSTCYRQRQCWEGKFQQTFRLMKEMTDAARYQGPQPGEELPEHWKKHCVKPHQVFAALRQQVELVEHDRLWRKRIRESRRLVADQLAGVSRIMQDLAREIRREGQEMHLQEEQIREAVEGLGLSIRGVEIISLEEGNVEIEIAHTFPRGFDECRKMIAPLLTDILGEPIAVKSERPPERPGEPTVVTFASAKAYEVDTGVAGTAKGGGLLSGDSYSTAELANGKFAVAVSDGMGAGERARLESRSALDMLHQLLQSGMDEKLAIQSVNSVLLLRSADEMFATVDLALIDRYTAKTTFLKVGSTPSYIKRGGDVIPIVAGNPPIGILQEIDVDLVRVQLYPGDTLIMMTDGVYDAPGHAVNKEIWMKRIIQELKSEDPQEMAEELLDTVLRSCPDGIRDDMTVVVARVRKFQPEWATFRWPGLTKLERPRTVS
ncbi:stage II sporulation protein E [Thermobacillus sp. ZCTH02-B1]|uniref:stage II sporulation protein E n=1 Tax=Thermobacillus sp. ZCTH02-B1 TaxID=1858795 RepID=UPI0025D9D0A6|nr:stage II sporulation protein E [Thermobacillus sp. ZCTH02-B1]